MIENASPNAPSPSVQISDRPTLDACTSSRDDAGATDGSLKSVSLGRGSYEPEFPPGRIELKFPSACVSSLGMIQTLFDSPWAI